MNKRLQNFRRMSAPAALGHAPAVPETVFEPVSGGKPAPIKPATNVKTSAAALSASMQSARSVGMSNATSAGTSAPSASMQAATSAGIPASGKSLFGIELTRDNCLIIAVILMLSKEKADIKLIIALIYLLL
jgi:hypothetical protein